MVVYLAGIETVLCYYPEDYSDIYTLTTFFYLRNKKDIPPHCRSNKFILDSGAFSFFGGGTVNWDKYVTQYINFINKYDIKLFFELDIYSIVGNKKTEQIRDRIEKETGKKVIPVWHVDLGIDYYKWMVDNYDYIAIGASGQHDSKWTRKEPEKLKALVLYAKKNGVKVHGLGYTNISMLKKIPFHSVDSTSWLSGNRFGVICRFNGSGFDKVKKPEGKKVKTKLAMKNNLEEWIKFQKYAEREL